MYPEETPPNGPETVMNRISKVFYVIQLSTWSIENSGPINTSKSTYSFLHTYLGKRIIYSRIQNYRSP